MRLSVAVPAVVLMIASTLLGLGLTAAGEASAARRRAEAVPRTGMDILNAHACGEGETKQIMVLGVEDGFSPAGSEAGFIRAGRNDAARLPRSGTGEYDQVNVDRGFTDSFKVEGRVASGLFVMRARSLNGSDNDSLAFGNLAVDVETESPGLMGGGLFANLPKTWSTEGEVIYASLENLRLFEATGGNWSNLAVPGGVDLSLGSYLNDPNSPGWLDIMVQDDTAVDFMGLALCRPPAVRKGVTLAPTTLPGHPLPDVIDLTCFGIRKVGEPCDPYVGDTVCSAALPVACLRPGNAPSPVRAGSVARTAWTGGSLAVTEPVRGDSFRTIRDVQRLCAARFGPDWRVANINDGGRFLIISAQGDRRTVTGRVWVDAVNQPHGVCWARE